MDALGEAALRGARECARAVFEIQSRRGARRRVRPRSHRLQRRERDVRSDGLRRARGGIQSDLGRRAQIPPHRDRRRHRYADAAVRGLPADPVGVLRGHRIDPGEPARQDRNASNLPTFSRDPSMLRSFSQRPFSCSFRPLSLHLTPSPPTAIWSARYVITMDAQRRVIENGAVAVRGERIVAVGTKAEIDRRFQPKQRLDRPDAILAPGLINTHAHAAMSLFRGIADDMRLQDWLEKFIFPAEAKNVFAGIRPLGHAPGLSRNAAGGRHHLHGHVLLRGRGGGGYQRSRHARGAGRDHHRLPRARQQDARRRLEVHRALHHPLPQRSSHRAGGRAARAVHELRRDPEGFARAGESLWRAAGDPPFGNQEGERRHAWPSAK